MDDDDDIELESSEDSNSERGQPRRSRRRPRFTYENDDEELAANLQFGHSEDENEADFQDFSDESEAEDDVKDEGDLQPAWKKMNLQVGELVVLNGGPGDQWWVAKVLQLCDVVYDAQNPDLHDGDIQVVQQYNGSGRSAVFTPTKGNKQRTWAQCVDQIGGANLIFWITTANFAQMSEADSAKLSHLMFFMYS